MGNPKPKIWGKDMYMMWAVYLAGYKISYTADYPAILG